MIKATILLALLCIPSCASCAKQKPAPYEEAGYVRFGGGRPHVLPSQPSYPYYPRQYPRPQIITIPTR